MTQFLIAESLKNDMQISKHKVSVSSQIFEHNFLTTHPSNIWFAPWFSVQNEIYIYMVSTINISIFTRTPYSKQNSYIVRELYHILIPCIYNVHT